MASRAWRRRQRLGKPVWLQILGFMLVMALLMGGCAGDDYVKKREAKISRDMGARFLRAGETTKALQYFLKAYEKYPDDPYLHYDLAYTYDLKGVLERTEFHLKEAIRLKPDYSVAHNYLGVIYYRTGRVELAIKSYHKALENVLYFNPQNAHFNLGVAYLSLKDYDQAVFHLKEAIKMVPDYAAAYNNLGKAYEGLKNYDAAKRAYRKAVEFDPESAQAHLDLGKFLYKIEERQAAAGAFDKVIRLAPGSNMAVEARSYLDKLR